MRLRFAACALAAGLCLWPDVMRSELAAAASALFEATPFLLAGLLLARWLPSRGAAAYLGCGCGSGPSARSLPAAAAAWLVFGPAIAAARLAAAAAVAWALTKRAPPPCGCGCERPRSLLDELASLLPAALGAGIATHLTSAADLHGFPGVLQFAAGAAAGFVAAPCGLGAVAIAGALHARAPLTADGFLCIAGIADLRALTTRTAMIGCAGDFLGYLLLASALGIVASHRGAALVHPALALALAACCAIVAALALRCRAQQNARLAVAPALMLAAALVTAPPPEYRASETTMTELFPGERLSFTGVLMRDGRGAVLVRYAITCCRADAAPVAVRLARVPAFSPGTWLHADGRIVTQAGEPALAAREFAAIAPPADPFVYR